jgi:hypothetical protein
MTTNVRRGSRRGRLAFAGRLAYSSGGGDPNFFNKTARLL